MTSDVIRVPAPPCDVANCEADIIGRRTVHLVPDAASGQLVSVDARLCSEHHTSPPHAGLRHLVPPSND